MMNNTFKVGEFTCEYPIRDQADEIQLDRAATRRQFVQEGRGMNRHARMAKCQNKRISNTEESE